MGEMSCTPLSGGDETPRFSVDGHRTARKLWRCCECDTQISPGARHHYAKQLSYGGTWFEFRSCLLCDEIRSHFGKHTGWTWGQLWDDLEAYFFPDMKAGGPCMEGLSPEAKARLFERCLAWRLR
jgi:hypothetical protein